MTASIRVSSAIRRITRLAPVEREAVVMRMADMNPGGIGCPDSILFERQRYDCCIDRGSAVAIYNQGMIGFKCIIRNMNGLQTD